MQWQECTTDLFWNIDRVFQLGRPTGGVLQELGGGHPRGVLPLMLQCMTGDAALQAERLQQW